jgi:Holliday junction resolvase
MATEQQIQAKKIKELEAEGFYVLKLIKTNKNGIPDIVALHPDKRIEFYEVKTSKGKVSSLQEYRLKELKKYGFKAEVYRG